MRLIKNIINLIMAAVLKKRALAEYSQTIQVTIIFHKIYCKQEMLSQFLGDSSSSH